MESKITTSFEAKTEQKKELPTQLWRPPTRRRKIFLTETNFRCSVITKLEFRVELQPPRTIASYGKVRSNAWGGEIPPLGRNRVKR